MKRDRVNTVLAGALLLPVLVLAGCAGSPDQPPDGRGSAAVVGDPLEELISDLTPRGQQPVFLGISPRLRDREEEKQRAILHAAEQASRYTRMAAQYQIVTQRGGRAVGYVDDITANWDAPLADRLAEAVTVLEERQDERATYVLATVDGIPPVPPVSVNTSTGDVEPEWVNRPPQIPGFLVTVGVTQRSRSVRDSIDTADQDALKDILMQAGTTVRMIEERQDVERMGTLESAVSAHEAAAILRQFLVLARYIPPDGRYYYSLVIAREE